MLSNIGNAFRVYGIYIIFIVAVIGAVLYFSNVASLSEPFGPDEMVRIKSIDSGEEDGAPSIAPERETKARPSRGGSPGSAEGGNVEEPVFGAYGYGYEEECFQTIDGKKDTLCGYPNMVSKCDDTGLGGAYVGTLYYSIAQNGDVSVYYEQSKGLNDNSYGANIVNWPRSHSFSNLVGSDKAQFIFRDRNGNIVLDFYMDYITSSGTAPSGYACLGVSGGDGKMIVGSASNILAAKTSLDYNFNVLNHILTSNSPQTVNSSSYDLVPGSPYQGWLFENAYEVKVSGTAFGTAGFGSVEVAVIHNSPPKMGSNAAYPESCNVTSDPYPVLEYIDPTPPNNSVVYTNAFTVNISISEDAQTSYLYLITDDTLWDNVKHLGIYGGMFDYNASLGIDGMSSLQMGQKQTMAASETHTCYILENGNSACYGKNDRGQATNYTGGDAIAVSAGKEYTCYLLDSGDSVCYGKNDNGRATGYDGGDAIAVASGNQHTCYLLDSGNSACYGLNDAGSTTNYMGGDAIGVAVGERYTCYLLESGNSICYGKNDKGQATNYMGGDAIAVDTDKDFTCYLLKSGNSTCFGANDGGQATPYKGGDAIALATGDDHVCYLLESGNSICYGKNDKGRATPYTGGDAIMVSAGKDYTCYLLSSGDSVCYGYDHYGDTTGHTGGNIMVPFEINRYPMEIHNAGENTTADYALTDLPDGTYIYWTDATDMQGNTNKTERRVVIINNTNIPISFVSPTDLDNSYVPRDYILANVTASPAGFSSLTIYVYDGAGSLVTSESSSSPNKFANFSGLADGTYYINATGQLISGLSNSTETRRITVDSTYPSVQFVDPTEPSGSIVTKDYALINVSASDANLETLALDIYYSDGFSVVLIDSYLTSSGNLFVNMTSLSDGTYFFNATAIDKAGNANYTETRNFTARVTPPSVLFVPPTPPSGSTQPAEDILVNITADDSNLENITVYLYDSFGNLLNSSTTSMDNLYINFSGLPDGLYYFNATAYDSAGNSNSTETRNVTIDTTKPTISFVPPTTESGATQATNSISANVTASDSNLDNIKIYLYSSLGGLVGFSTGQSSSLYANFSGLPDGIYYLNATAYDSAGNSMSTETRNVTIDTTNPSVSFVPPTTTSGSYLYSSSIATNVTGWDSNLVNITTYVYGSDGNLVNSSTSLYNNFSGLPDGLYYFNATAYDSAGNSNSTETRNVTIDTTKPTISFVPPTTASGTLQFSNSITANVTAYDANLDSIVVRLYTSSGILINSSSSNEPNLYAVFSGLPDGLYYFSAIAYDKAGNSRSTEIRNVTIDSTSPSISFVPPTTDSGMLQPIDSISANVTASDPNLNNITVFLYDSDGNLVNSTATTSTGLYVIFEGLDDGTYYFNATAYDNVGNHMSTETRNVTIDTVNPVISFVPPTTSSGAFQPTASITANVTASDPNLNNITVFLYDSDGNLIDSSSTTSPELYTIFSGLPDGTYYFNATAYDTMGNSMTTETRVVTIDTTDPEISFVDPTAESGSALSSPSFQANVTASDINLDTVITSVYYATGELAAQSDDLYSNFSGLPDGVYYFNATAYDLAGNSMSTETRTVTIDTTSPEAEFVAPTTESGSFLSSPSFLANVSVTDANPGTVITRVYDATGGMVAESNSTFNSFSGLPDGIYYFNATAYDDAGNSGSTGTWNVTIDTTSPSVSFVPPTPDSGTVQAVNYVSGNVTAYDMNLKNITVFLYDESGTPIGMQYSETSNLLFNFSGLPDGTYYFNATAYDMAGNENHTETRTIYLDTAYPTIDFIPPTIDSGTVQFLTSVIANVTAYNVHLTGITVFLYDSYGNLINSSSTASDNIYAEFPDLPDGLYYFNATAYDAAGNFNSTETRNVTIDTVNPLMIFVDPTKQSGSYTNGDVLVNVSLSRIDNETVVISIYDSSGNLADSSLGLFASFSGLQDGIYYFNATATDIFGDPISTETRNITIDTVAPELEIIRPIMDNFYDYNPIEVHIVATDENPIDSIWFTYDNGITNITYTDIMNQTFPEGDVHMTAWANDSAGNVGSAEVLFTVSVPPIVTIQSPSNSTYQTVNVNLKYTVRDSNVDSCWYIFRGVMNALPDCQNISLSGLSNGAYYVEVYANDTLGNVGNDSVHFSVKKDGGGPNPPPIYPPTYLPALYIYPIDDVAMMAGANRSIGFLVKNIGEVPISNIDNFIDSSLPSTHSSIGYLGVNLSKYVEVVVTANGIGIFPATARASATGVTASREFNIIVNGAACVGDDCGYQCIVDDDCGETQKCINGTCVDIPGGDCGYYANHSFIRYECCSDADCVIGQRCIDHNCMTPGCEGVTFIMLQDRIPNEGADVTLTLLNMDRAPIQNSLVLGLGYTNLAGQITVVARQTQRICVEIENCTVCKRISMASRGVITAEDNETQGNTVEFVVTDDYGNPLPFARVYLNDTYIGDTDSGGRINDTIYYVGQLVVKAEKPGYEIEDVVINMLQRPNVCFLPFNVLPWIYIELIYWWILAIFSIIFMASSFFILWRVMERKAITSVVYAILPLAVFLFNETFCGLFSASLILLVLAVAVFEFMAIFGIYLHERARGKPPAKPPAKPAHAAAAAAAPKPKPAAKPKAKPRKK